MGISLHSLKPGPPARATLRGLLTPEDITEILQRSRPAIGPATLDCYLVRSDAPSLASHPRNGLQSWRGMYHYPSIVQSSEYRDSPERLGLVLYNHLGSLPTLRRGVPG